MRELRRRLKPEVEALSEYLGRDLVPFWGYDDLADPERPLAESMRADPGRSLGPGPRECSRRRPADLRRLARRARGSTVRSPVRLPDFFIVGHQKCGTTALYMMLRDHPRSSCPMSRSRSSSRPISGLAARAAGRRASARRPRTLDAYLALFAAAGPEQRAGEASAQYLRSKTAAGGIAAVQPAARIIAILREPASFLRSFHLQMVSSRVETETDFQAAIAREDDRRAGRRIPRGCHHPEALLYSDHVRYVEQLRRFTRCSRASRCWC